MWSTGRRVARVTIKVLLRWDHRSWDLCKVRLENFEKLKKSLTWLRITSCEWISSVSIHTVANGTVVINSTFGVLTASIWTRIDTLLVYASFVITAFRADNTLRSTTWWTTNVVWQTRTYCLIIDFTTLRVWTARRWLTWVDICRCDS